MDDFSMQYRPRMSLKVMAICVLVLLVGCGAATPSDPSSSEPVVVTDSRPDDSNRKNPSQSVKVCESPRPELCASIYDPVCATRGDGSSVTRSNGCRACADPEVESYVRGACSQAPAAK